MEPSGAQCAYRFWRMMMRMLFATSCRPRFLRRNLTERSGAWILVSNHISHFDPPILSTAVSRKIDWMAMEELFGNSVFGFLLRTVSAFPVSRGKPDRTALRTAVERLSQGRVVGILPDGGPRDGEDSLLEGGVMRPGLAWVASSSKAPVIPCVILGTDRLYNLRRWLPVRRTPIWIGFGEALDPPEPGREARELFDVRLRSALQSLRDEMVETFRLDPADLPHSPQSRQRESSGRDISDTGSFQTP